MLCDLIRPQLHLIVMKIFYNTNTLQWNKYHIIYIIIVETMDEIHDSWLSAVKCFIWKKQKKKKKKL